MVNETLKQKIREVLKRGYFHDESDFVDVSDGYMDMMITFTLSS